MCTTYELGVRNGPMGLGLTRFGADGHSYSACKRAGTHRRILLVFRNLKWIWWPQW
jgi:hypothetical protein